MKSKDPAKREEAESFVTLMLELAEQRALPIYVVMTMRSDFLGECDNFHGLPEALNRSQYLVPRLTRKQRQLAVEGPVRLCGRKVTPRLLDCVLNEAGDQSDQLPVIQHALMRTWEKWSLTDDKELDLPHYKAAGKIKWALSNDAEKALDGLSPDELEIVKRMFQALTATDQDNRRTSHPSHFTQLLAVTGATPEQLDKVIERFRGDGRSFLVSDKSDDPLISISHESLIRQWKTLNDWINDELYSVDIYTRLADDAARYEKQPSKGRLWRNPELEEALEWREQRNPNQPWAARYHPKFEASMNFLDKSREESEKDALEEKRQRQVEEELKQTKGREEKLRRMLTIIPVIFGLFLLSVASTIYASMQKSDADRERKEAFKQRGMTEVQRQEAISKANLARDQGIEAEKQRTKAEQSADEAQEQRKRAEKLANLANNEKNRAEKKSLEAQEQQYVAYIGLAQNAIEEANNGRAEHLLDSLQPGSDRRDLRSFPWYHLWLREQQAKLNANAGRIRAVALASNTRANDRELALLAAASENKTVIVWDANTRQLVARLSSHHKGNVSSVAFSPDGELMATASDDDTVKLWDIQTRKELTPPLKGHLAGVRSVAFSPDGLRVATASKDSTVKVWDLCARKELMTLEGHESNVSSVIFLSDSKLATASSDLSVRLWNIKERQYRKTIFGAHQGAVREVAFSPDDKFLASGSDDNTVKIWDADTWQLVKNLEGHTGSVTSVYFSFDGKLLASASQDNTVRLWDTHSWKSLFTLEGHHNNVYSVMFSPDGKKVATASEDGTVKLWDPRSGRELKTLTGPDNPAISCVQFSPKDGKWLATANGDGTVYVWDTDSGELFKKRHSTGSAEGVIMVSFSPEGDMLASAGGGTARVWNLLNVKDEKPVKEINNLAYPSLAAFAPGNDKTLAVQGNDGALKLWDTRTWEELITLKGGSPGFNFLAFSHDGKKIATADDSGSITIWFAATEDEVKRLAIAGNSKPSP